MQETEAAVDEAHRVFVANFPFSTTPEELAQVAAEFGTVQDVKLIVDKFTGRSRGFGFLTFGSAAEATAAISGLDNKEFGGRSLRVNPVAPREPRFGDGNRDGGFRSGGQRTGGFRNYNNNGGGGGFRNNNNGFRNNRYPRNNAGGDWQSFPVGAEDSNFEE